MSHSCRQVSRGENPPPRILPKMPSALAFLLYAGHGLLHFAVSEIMIRRIFFQRLIFKIIQIIRAVFCRCKILHAIAFWKNHEGGISPRETC